MNAAARHEQILSALRAHGRVEVAELAGVFGVSEMTVRRDLEQLESQGLCRRVHGGAVPAASRSYEPPFRVRAAQQVDAKGRIGKAVAATLADHETVLLDIGTTTLEVARALKGRQGLTVVTHSVRIASELADEQGLRVICLGGIVRPGEQSLVGRATEEAMQQFYVDVCVLGVGGLDAEAGLTEFNLDDAAIKRVAIQRGRRVVVAADTSKLGGVAFAAIAPIDVVDTVVTDAPADHPEVAKLLRTEVGVEHA